MTFVKVTFHRFCRYFSYLWEGIVSRWKSIDRIGLFGFIKGFFKNFFESWSLVQIDIKEGYI